MALTFPLAFPDMGMIEKLSWRAKSIVSANRSIFTGAREVQRHQGQWWEAVVSIVELNSIDESENWISFLLALNGRENTFLFGDPVATSPRGTALGSGVVNGASQIGNELITNGWTPSQGTLFKAGDFIQLGTAGTSRLHKILQDVASDVSGNATLDIFPILRESPVDASAITVTNTKGVFSLAQDISNWDLTPPLRYGISFAIEEAF